MARYQQSADDIREAFASANITVIQLDSSRSLDDTAQELASLLVAKEL